MSASLANDSRARPWVADSRCWCADIAAFLRMAWSRRPPRWRSDRRDRGRGGRRPPTASVAAPATPPTTMRPGQIGCGRRALEPGRARRAGPSRSTPAAWRRRGSTAAGVSPGHPLAISARPARRASARRHHQHHRDEAGRQAVEGRLARRRVGAGQHDDAGRHAAVRERECRPGPARRPPTTRPARPRRGCRRPAAPALLRRRGRTRTGRRPSAARPAVPGAPPRSSTRGSPPATSARGRPRLPTNTWSARGASASTSGATSAS